MMEVGTKRALGLKRSCAPRQKKADKATKQAQAIAWKAQKRLCHRYRVLLRNGKEPGKVTTATAREMSGFVWAIACAVMAEQKTK